MTLGEFKIRYLRSKINPILFYLPVKKNKDPFQITIQAKGYSGQPLKIKKVSVYFYYFDTWTNKDENGNTISFYNPFEEKYYYGEDIRIGQNNYYRTKYEMGGLTPIICINDQQDHIIKYMTQFEYPIKWEDIAVVPTPHTEKTPILMSNNQEVEPSSVSNTQTDFYLSAEQFNDTITLKNLQKGELRVSIEVESYEPAPEDERYDYLGSSLEIDDPNIEQKQIDYADYVGEGPYSMEYSYQLDSSYFHFNDKGKLSLINGANEFSAYTKEESWGWTNSEPKGYQFYHLKYLFPNNTIVYKQEWEKRLHKKIIQFRFWVKRANDSVNYSTVNYSGYGQNDRFCQYNNCTFFSGLEIWENMSYPEDEEVNVSPSTYKSTSITNYDFLVGEWQIKTNPKLVQVSPYFLGFLSNNVNNQNNYFFEYERSDLEEITVTKNGTSADVLPNKIINLYFKSVHSFEIKTTQKTIPTGSLNYYIDSNGNPVYCSKIVATECYIDGNYVGYYAVGGLSTKVKSGQQHDSGIQYFGGKIFEYNSYINADIDFSIHYIMPGESGEEYVARNKPYGYFYYDLNKDDILGVQFNLIDNNDSVHSVITNQSSTNGQSNGILIDGYMYAEWYGGLYTRETSPFIRVYQSFFHKNCYNDILGVDYNNHSCQSYYYLGDGLTKENLATIFNAMILGIARTRS